MSETTPPRPEGRVAIIGGGWAGCAAASVLAGHGVPVSLYEAGPVLGGRARRVMRDGLPIDNGQHLLLGAYQATRHLIWAVHAHTIDGGLRRLPLAIAPFTTDPRSFSMRAAPLPQPLDLLIGLLAARGLKLRERVAAIKWFARLKRERFRRPPGETVAQMLTPLPRAVADQLWAPLCVAALNTLPAVASAQMFANVLRRAFGGTRGASDLLVPEFDLSELMPDAAARILEARNCAIHVRTTVQVRALGPKRVDLVAGARRWHKPAVIIAAGPHQLQALFVDEARTQPAIAALLAQCDAFTYEPIATIYLGYRNALPVPARMARLDDAPGQWLFDRQDVLARAPDAAVELGIKTLVAVVVSASGPHTALDSPGLILAVAAQLRRLRPDWPNHVWSQVIVERRATYACTPELQRPKCGRLEGRLYLAGDYTDPDLPATLEAAVRSGEAAARALLADHPSAGR
jgi:hydroxysqualene dehydroxylase